MRRRRSSSAPPPPPPPPTTTNAFVLWFLSLCVITGAAKYSFLPSKRPSFTTTRRLRDQQPWDGGDILLNDKDTTFDSNLLNRRRHTNTLSTSLELSTTTTTTTTLLRGGATVVVQEEEENETEDDDDDVGVIILHLRTFVRKLMKATQFSPSLQAIVKRVALSLESMIGTKLLLPTTTTTTSKKKKKKKRRKKQRPTTTTTSKEEEEEEEDVQQDDDDSLMRETTKKKTKKRKSTSSSSSRSSKTTTNKSKSGTTHPPANNNNNNKSKKKKKQQQQKQKQLSPAAKKHLETQVRTTSPNYRIQRELKEFLQSPPDGLKVKVGSNLRVWIVLLTGAPGTIYEGEEYKLRIAFPKAYPTVPPSVYFLQPTPQHEHVYTNGDICLSLLGKGWRPTMTAQSIAVSILSILSSAKTKAIPMDNARHAQNKPGQYQKDWIYHDDNC